MERLAATAAMLVLAVAHEDVCPVKGAVGVGRCPHVATPPAAPFRSDTRQLPHTLPRLIRLVAKLQPSCLLHSCCTTSCAGHPQTRATMTATGSHHIAHGFRVASNPGLRIEAAHGLCWLADAGRVSRGSYPRGRNGRWPTCVQEWQHPPGGSPS